MYMKFIHNLHYSIILKVYYSNWRDVFQEICIQKRHVKDNVRSVAVSFKMLKRVTVPRNQLNPVQSEVMTSMLET